MSTPQGEARLARGEHPRRSGWKCKFLKRWNILNPKRIVPQVGWIFLSSFGILGVFSKNHLLSKFRVAW